MKYAHAGEDTRCDIIGETDHKCCSDKCDISVVHINVLLKLRHFVTLAVIIKLLYLSDGGKKSVTSQIYRQKKSGIRRCRPSGCD